MSTGGKIMSNFKFDKLNDLIGFLFEATDNINEKNFAFDLWEVTYVSLNTSQGLELSLNTKIVDTTGINEYMFWKNVKPLVRSYITQDMIQEFSNEKWYDRIPTNLNYLDIRFRCSRDLKNTFDTLAQFDSFRLNFVIDKGLFLVLSTAVEKEFPVDVEPIEKWNTYISDTVARWKSDNGR